MLLGELLVAQGLARSTDIETALARQERRGGRIGENLIALGIITRDMLEAALREQYEQVKAILGAEDLLAKSKRRNGSDHPRTDRRRCQLAGALIAAGRLTEGLNLAQTALAGHEKALGSQHAWTKASAQTVADAIAALERAAAIDEATAELDLDTDTAGADLSPGERPAVAAGIGAGE
jgi:hypothetical protein